MSDQTPLPSAPALPLISTGNLEIDQSLTSLDDLEKLPVTEHAQVYADIHSKLSSALTDISN